MNNIHLFLVFLKDVIKSRKVILELTKKDFTSRYLGSYLGILWAFISPAITILIFWFVFQVGFKTAAVGDFPYILWLMAGMIPWFFFGDSVSSAANSITDNGFLVKKVVFRVSVLPIVKIASALIIHLFFVAVLVSMFMIYGHTPDLYTLQVIYYLFASIVLLLGLSWITSSLIIFLKDLGQIVAMLLQFGFWMTPIFWTLKNVPAKYHTLLKINPAYYIVEGYRDSFINKIWFWEHYRLTAYFWLATAVIFVFGAVLFRKLRPHFADVL